MSSIGRIIAINMKTVSVIVLLIFTAPADWRYSTFCSSSMMYHKLCIDFTVNFDHPSSCIYSILVAKKKKCKDASLICRDDWDCISRDFICVVPDGAKRQRTTTHSPPRRKMCICPGLREVTRKTCCLLPDTSEVPLGWCYQGPHWTTHTDLQVWGNLTF